MTEGPESRQKALKLAKEALLGFDDMSELLMAARYISTGRVPYEDPPETNPLLAKLAAEKCETLTTGSCLEDPTKSFDPGYLADQYCPPCRVRYALARTDITKEAS